MPKPMLICWAPLLHFPHPVQNEAADAAAAATLAGLPAPKGSTEFWRVLQQFTLNNAHYYCETADISRPFPRWVSTHEQGVKPTS